MNLAKADRLVERGASALEGWARDLAVNGGAKRQLAEELLEDAAFLRKLKPSLIAARVRGETPTPNAGRPETTVSVPDAPVSADDTPVPATAPALAEPKPSPPKPSRARGGGGLNPFAVVGIAFVAGIVLAKVVDWRSHAHPKR